MFSARQEHREQPGALPLAADRCLECGVVVRNTLVPQPQCFNGAAALGGLMGERVQCRPVGQRQLILRHDPWAVPPVERPHQRDCGQHAQCHHRGRHEHRHRRQRHRDRRDQDLRCRLTQAFVEFVDIRSRSAQQVSGACRLHHRERQSYGPTDDALAGIGQQPFAEHSGSDAGRALQDCLQSHHADEHQRDDVDAVMRGALGHRIDQTAEELGSGEPDDGRQTE